MRFLPVPPTAPHLFCLSYTVTDDNELMLWGRGLHSTEVAFLLLTQQPWVQFLACLKFFLWIFQCCWDLLAALLRVKWTESVKCQSNPSSSGKYNKSSTTKKESKLYFLMILIMLSNLSDSICLQPRDSMTPQCPFCLTSISNSF